MCERVRMPSDARRPLDGAAVMKSPVRQRLAGPRPSMQPVSKQNRRHASLSEVFWARLACGCVSLPT